MKKKNVIITITKNRKISRNKRKGKISSREKSKVREVKVNKGKGNGEIE